MTALYPGSFDPVTLGHLDVIARAAHVFDRVIVGVLHNPNKASGAFPVDTRLRLLGDAAAAYPNVAVAAYAGLLTEVVQEARADVVIRGLRGASDVEDELAMARLNRQLGRVETFFIAASPEVTHISATRVREIGRLGGSLRGLVPETIRARVEAALLS